MLALSVKGLSKTYSNGHQALNSIDLEIKKGEFLALLGKNGAGKTTFVEILSSLTQKTNGNVLVHGKNLELDNEFVKSCVGVVPQEANLSIFEKVLPILITQAGYFGISSSIAYQRAEKLLKDLDLWNRRDSKAITLSGGMKRRLMIAKALMHEPDIIFFDEPTAGVDVEVRKKIWEIMCNLNKRGKTIILTTHYFEEAEKLCNSLAVISKGKIVVHEDLAKIFSNYSGQKYLIELEDTKNIKTEGLNIKYLLDNRFEIIVDSKNTLTKSIGIIISQGQKIKNIQPQKSRLEELFLDITN